MNFEISLEQFTGPLDLMLYLIKDKKLDLFDLNIGELADQYITFLNQVSEQKLEIASEYLSELAGLIEYKSKRLLPRDQSELEAADVETQEDNLVKRLLEYQRYKEVSEDLAKRFEARLQQYDKPVSIELLKNLKQKMNDTLTYEQTPYDLIGAMQKVLTRYHLAHPHDVAIERVELSVDDALTELRLKFQAIEVIQLEDLLLQSYSIQHFLVTFLAVLDMLRLQELKMNVQDERVFLKGAF